MGEILIATLLGYFLGSIPFGPILTRLFKIGDLRKIGSGNIGATNVLRMGRKDIAALTLFLDAGKGAVAVLLALHFLSGFAALLVGFAAVIGHIFPVWLRFNGGKGVATCYGVLLAISWVGGVVAILLWILVASISRYSSLAALVSLTIAPLFIYFQEGHRAFWLAILLALVVWVTHYQNIKRLFKGTESRIDFKR